MIEETIRALQALLDQERHAVMHFDGAACAAIAVQKIALARQLEQLLKGADVSALRSELSRLRQRMHQNHALLGFAHSTMRAPTTAQRRHP